MPYDVGPDTMLTITGRLSDARYMSFNTYGSKAANFTYGAASALADYRIAPDAGSANPWRQSSTGWRVLHHRASGYACECPRRAAADARRSIRPVTTAGPGRARTVRHVVHTRRDADRADADAHMSRPYVRRPSFRRGVLSPARPMMGRDPLRPGRRYAKFCQS